MDRDLELQAKPAPRNTARARYATLQACWVLTIALAENGEATATLGKLDLASKRMRFSQLSRGTWEGPVDAAAADTLVRASEEVRVDTGAQLALF